MPQDATEPDVWELDLDTLELLPLIVENADVATDDYLVACVPLGSSDTPVWAAPDTANGETGFMVDGAALGEGTFKIKTKIDAGPEQVVRTAAVLKLTQ